MEDIEKLFGNRIKVLRTRAGLTQEALAERMGMNPVYIGDIERGRGENPTFQTLMKLAQALEAKPWELFFFNVDPVDVASTHKYLSNLLRQALERADETERSQLIALSVQLVDVLTRNK